jgi:hypothetical protein
MAGMVAAAVLGPRWLATEQDGPDGSAEPGAVCHPLQEVCRWQTPAGEATVSMTALEGDELRMNVTLPDDPGQVIAILTGESMYMGEYPLRMEATGETGHFRVRFVPPFCSTGGDMVWRVNLKEGADTMAMPFRLLFRPDPE